MLFRSRGLTKPPNRWSAISIGAIAMGQEVGVTPLQIVTMAAAVANGGWWVPPHIVQEGFRGARASLSGPPRRIMSEQTAAAMSHMMSLVVTNGTAKTAILEGFTSAGKTGTAQKIDPRTRTYSPHDYVASFVGFTPVENPQYAILVVVDSPRGKIYGGDVAAPVFKRISEQILAYRNISPTLPMKQTLVKTAYNAPRPEETSDFAPEPSLAAGGEEGAEANSAAMLNLNPGELAPNFVGKTVRSVVEQAQLDGVEVQLIGSGIAYRQSPEPGSPLPEGQKLSVWFKVGGTARVAQMSQQSRNPARPRMTPPAAAQAPSAVAPQGTGPPPPPRPKPVQPATSTTIATMG